MLKISSFTDYLEGCSAALWDRVEEALLPLSKDCQHSKFFHTLPAVLILPALMTDGLSAICRAAAFAMHYFHIPKDENPHQDFSAVCQDSRLWEKLGPIDPILGQKQPDFLWGVATATYQDSGSSHCPASQWVEREQDLPLNNRSEGSANLFELYKTHKGRQQIISHLQELGVNSYRFSVEWSQIEPEEGAFDSTKLQVYVKLCRHLRREGIQPMVTLHHFSEPLWFYKKGSFENEDNIDDFVAFVEKIVHALTEDFQGKPLVEYFCTINEPAIEAFSRYVRGAFLPKKRWQFKKAGQFLLGALKAHALAYKALKEINPSLQIGIVHQRLSFVPANFLLSPITRYLTHLVNEVSLHFFRTGIFELKIPFFCHIIEKLEKPPADFVGLQYYTRPVIGLTGSTSFYEPMTLMPFREDPEGLYEAIIEVYANFQVPVIVTENGISTTNPTQRSRYISRALYAAQRAQDKIGLNNLRGYFYWSFCDNFEWDMGMNPQRFGAFALETTDGERVLARKPKEGMEVLVRVINTWRETFRD